MRFKAGSSASSLGAARLEQVDMMDPVSKISISCKENKT
jgi:hypothetical protein